MEGCLAMVSVGLLQSLWEKPIWEGSDGSCVFTHSVYGMEGAREVWAAWRALFLRDSTGAGDGAGQ